MKNIDKEIDKAVIKDRCSGNILKLKKTQSLLQSEVYMHT